MKKFNSFHLVTPSPWPIMTSFNFLSFTLSVVIMVKTYSFLLFMISFLLFMISSYLWGQDMHRESCYMGEHNSKTMKGFKTGMLFFIMSEIFFFLGMFWSYMHLAEAPDMELGGFWPPLGINCFDPMGIPFLNTILLVSSGVSVTWCHHSLEKNLYWITIKSLSLTILLGLTFTSFQMIEYFVANFTFACSSYSSIYFLGTGFHGLHVLIGSILLTMCLYRFTKLFNSPSHSVGFECSVWYWHFVDIVWFFLYLIFYWWGV